MKHFVGVFLVLGGMLLAGVFGNINKGLASDLCESSAGVGSVTVGLPPVQVGREYLVWVRLQSPSAEARLLMQTNQTNCIDFATATQSGQWSWHKILSNQSPYTIQFAKERGNTITVYGVQDGLRIDKLIVSEPDCVPIEFGANCKTNVEAQRLCQDDVTTLPPPSQGKIQGKIYISRTPQDVGEDLKSVSYVVGGRTVQSSSEPIPFDTTYIENGKHTVLVETVLMTGGSIQESVVIDVDNPQTAISPIVRWYKQHNNSIKLTLVGIASIIIMLLFIMGARAWYHRHRSLKFHGF